MEGGVINVRDRFSVLIETMSEQASQLLNLVNNGRYVEALLFFQKHQEQDPESLRKLAIDTIFDAATKFRDNNDNHLRALVTSLFDAIHSEPLKFRICFNFITGRTTSHFNELLTNQLRSLISEEFKERHGYEWDELCNVLPMKLEENLAKEDDPNFLDSAVEAADILYSLRGVPFIIPERMTVAFTAAVHSKEMELPGAYERFFVRPVDVALARIMSTVDDLDTADIDLCTRLILPLLRFIEDFQQHSFRVSIMKKCRELIRLFPSKPRVLLIKNVLTKIFDSLFHSDRFFIAAAAAPIACSLDYMVLVSGKCN
ncbi:hypothetical protein ANCDUO_06003 [Ancylostoma duodenale]|uniref:Uncharacterized protein n=1 Tax=Ancylostoma duodenale TaxID=51022 RepID=A0A0C2GQX0_9BILA|nr:hypothetical protein ANCDUO_06003 [Ancylostoma duodenale]